MIRILHLLPGNMNMGGIESYLMNIYRNIDRKKIQFDFIVHTEEENYYEKEIKELGGKCYRLPIKAKNIKKYEKELEELLKKHKEYKTIHIHATYAFSKVEARVAKKSGIKNVIFHSHNTNAICKRKIIHYIYKNKIDKYIDYPIACSMAAAKWMYNGKILKKQKYTIWNNTIDASYFAYQEEIRNKIRKKYKINKNTLLVGNVGRLSYQKNPERVISIFNEIKKQNQDSVLFILGDGEKKEKLKRQIRKLEIEDSVFLLGNVDHVEAYMQAFDIFLFPTRYEGLGIVLIEAQAAGLKCFTSATVVPIETKITDLITYIDLKKNDSYWSRKILGEKDYKRTNTKEQIQKANFDNDFVQEIEKFYLKIN